MNIEQDHLKRAAAYRSLSRLEKIEASRKMSEMERVAMGCWLGDLERWEEAKRIREQNPEWDEKWVEREVLRRFGRKAGIPERYLPPPEDLEEPLIVYRQLTETRSN